MNAYAPYAPPTRRWWTLAVLSLAQLMVALDATVINIAMPEAQRDLGFDAASRQWPVTAYTLAFGSLLLLGGRLSDLLGRRTMLIVGLVGFASASVFAGAATNFTMLVAARFVQGAFGAVLAPAVLAALTTTFFEPKERAKAFAVYGALGASGAAIGLLLGGALTQWASWRWSLYVNVIFAGVALIGVVVLIAPGRAPERPRLDVLGTLLVSGALFFVVYGLSHVLDTSWDVQVTVVNLVAGVLLLVAFFFWQRYSSHPLVAPRLFTRTRVGSLVALLFTSFGLLAFMLFFAYYMESGLGYSPLRTGVYFLPMVGAIVFSASIASARLLAKVGPRPMVPTGMLLAMLAMILFTRLPVHADYLVHGLPGLIVMGLGLGLIFAPAIASATAGVEARDAGVASALVNTTQQVGASMGVALLNTIAVAVTARVMVNPGGPANLAQGATLHGYSVALWWAAGFFGVGALLSFILLESGPPDDDVIVAI